MPNLIMMLCAGSLLTDEEQEKKSASDVIIYYALLLHMQNLIMTLCAQNARHKMAAPIAALFFLFFLFQLLIYSCINMYIYL